MRKCAPYKCWAITATASPNELGSYAVADPERYGVVEFNSEGRAIIYGAVQRDGRGVGG